MSLASLVDRYGHAIVTVTLVLAAAGLYAAFALPSDIYPPLIFPRVVVIGHSGTIPAQSMMLTVTRPIEQALLVLRERHGGCLQIVVPGRTPPL